MRPLRFLGMALAVLTFTGCSGKKEATNAEKIIGTWEVTKPGKETPPGAVVEFTKDGKLTMTAKIKDKTEKMEGQYKIEGDKIMETHKQEEKEVKETLKIKTLTDTSLIIEDEKGNVDEFKKK